MKQDYGRQAITTKYIGPTDTRGSRVKAECAAGTRFYHWKSELDSFENHRAAAHQLCQALNWPGLVIGGCLKDGRYCWVMVP